jgi:hypothetical protein
LCRRRILLLRWLAWRRWRRSFRWPRLPCIHQLAQSLFIHRRGLRLRDAVLVGSYVGLGWLYFEQVIRQRDECGFLLFFDRNNDWPAEIPFRYKDQQRNDNGVGDQGDPCRLAPAVDRDNVIFFRQISRENMQTRVCRRDLQRHFCLRLFLSRTPFFFYYRNKPPPACVQALLRC